MTTPTTEDLLNSLGLTRLEQNSTPDWAVPAVLFGAGVMTGAATALLLAPKSGRELRSDIATEANKLGTAVAERIPGVNNEEGTFQINRQAQIEAK